jgi:5-methylthioadenosine/S-adenosylhomocysteine deaminase
MKVDVLISGIDWLITVDKERRIIRDASVAILDGRFVRVGKRQDVEQDLEPATTISGAGRVGLPGMVDNHLHSSFQLSRGLADEVPAQTFLFERMYPFEGAQEEEDVYASSLAAARELLLNGVTCFVDPGNYQPDATIRAVDEVGIRAVVARSTFDRTKSVMGLLPARMIETREEALAASVALAERVAALGNDRITSSFSFRGLNNCSDELITDLASEAERLDTFFQTHACFSYTTHDGCVSQFGFPEIERLHRLGVLSDRAMLVHGGWVEPHELRLLADAKPTVVLAASSSMHSGYGDVRVGLHPEMLAFGVNVSLGSDHASSGCTDMLLEMLLTANGYKETRINPRVLPPETVVEMATINGARGARLDDRLGSVEVGKLGDLVLFDSDRPEWQPMFNPVSNLVYSATGASVHTVLVGGRVVVEGRRLVACSEERIQSEIDACVLRLRERLDIPAMVSLTWPVS